MLNDRKVPFLSERTLAHAADRLRRVARRLGKYPIDIVGLIQNVLIERLAATEGLRVEIFEGNKFDEPAIVNFTEAYPRITLHVRRNVWNDAKLGFAYAYYVLAHEIAHVLFHDHKAIAFSSDPLCQIQYVVPECRAEWQADIFAKHLTMPDQALGETTNVSLLAILCNVEERFATERVKAYIRTGAMMDPSAEGQRSIEVSNANIPANPNDDELRRLREVLRRFLPEDDWI
jgi:hypothetical protein